MKEFIACCGLDCETCEARIATINNDDALRESVAKKWSDFNKVKITPQMINCEGCRTNGIKTDYCQYLCSIRKCVMAKKFDTCADCDKLNTCGTLKMITMYNQDALDNLRGTAKAEFKIRLATEGDAQAVHDIYGSYVPLDYVTFTVENPSVDHYRKKIAETLEKYPFLVAEGADKKILGYACGSPLRPHDAYQWNVEWTIMLAEDAPRRQGIATALYKEFARLLALQGYRYIYGVLVDTNQASVALHKKLGFKEAGHFESAGFKMGKWRGILWYVKEIGSSNEPPKKPLSLSEAM